MNAMFRNPRSNFAPVSTPYIAGHQVQWSKLSRELPYLFDAVNALTDGAMVSMTDAEVGAILTGVSHKYDNPAAFFEQITSNWALMQELWHRATVNEFRNEEMKAGCL